MRDEKEIKIDLTNIKTGVKAKNTSNIRKLNYGEVQWDYRVNLESVGEKFIKLSEDYLMEVADETTQKKMKESIEDMQFFKSMIGLMDFMIKNKGIVEKYNDDKAKYMNMNELGEIGGGVESV